MSLFSLVLRVILWSSCSFQSVLLIFWMKQRCTHISRFQFGVRNLNLVFFVPKHPWIGKVIHFCEQRESKKALCSLGAFVLGSSFLTGDNNVLSWLWATLYNQKTTFMCEDDRERRRPEDTSRHSNTLSPWRHLEYWNYDHWSTSIVQIHWKYSCNHIIRAQSC